MSKTMKLHQSNYKKKNHFVYIFTLYGQPSEHKMPFHRTSVKMDINSINQIISFFI